MKNNKEFEKIVEELDGDAAKKLQELRKNGTLDTYLKGITTMEDLQKKNPVDASVFQVLLEAFVERKAISNHTVAYLLGMEVELVDESLERLAKKGYSKLVIEQNSSFHIFIPTKG